MMAFLMITFVNLFLYCYYGEFFMKILLAAACSGAFFVWIEVRFRKNAADTISWTAGLVIKNWTDVVSA